MPPTGESLPAVPAGEIVLLHSGEKRRSVALGPAKGKRWQPSEWLVPADVRAIIAAATNDRDRLLLRVLWATGGRISEALALRACGIRRDASVLPNRKNPSRPVKTVFLAGRDMDRRANYCSGRRPNTLRMTSHCSARASGA